jgi:arylsulfatase A-like enzyme
VTPTRAPWRPLAAALLVALALGCAAPEETGPPARTAPPLAPGANVVLVSIDTLRADRLGSYGYPRPTSPSLDHLAAGGVRFENAFAESSWTLPSHVTLFTGLHPTSHGVTLEEHQLGAGIPTLTERLQAAGYQTFGFTAGGLLAARYGFDRGFDVYQDAYKLLPRTVRLASEALEGADPARPFFVFLHTYDVHCPYDPPERYALRFRTRPPEDHLEVAGRCGNPHFNSLDLTPGQVRFLSDQYDAGIRAADDHLSAFFRFLRDTGRWDDTVVAVVSDHGEELWEHGRIGHERTLHIETLRVPVILRVPGLPGRVVPEPIGLRDLAPTLLDLVGAPPLSAQGASLVPLAAGARPVELADRPSVSELDRHVHLRSIIQDGRHLIVDLGDPAHRLLYDLARDPREARSLAATADGERTARRLGRLLAAHLRGLPRPRTLRAAPVDPELKKQLEALGYL